MNTSEAHTQLEADTVDGDLIADMVVVGQQHVRMLRRDHLVSLAKVRCR